MVSSVKVRWRLSNNAEVYKNGCYRPVIDAWFPLEELLRKIRLGGLVGGVSVGVGC